MILRFRFFKGTPVPRSRPAAQLLRPATLLRPAAQRKRAATQLLRPATQLLRPAPQLLRPATRCAAAGKFSMVRNVPPEGENFCSDCFTQIGWINQFIMSNVCN